MVLRFYGVEKSENILARLSGHTVKAGVGGEGLVKAARKLGFKAFIKDFAGFGDIRKYVLIKKIPVIVDWFSENEGHYSVVAGIGRGHIYLQDPEIGGIRKMDLVTFKRVWFDFPGEFIKAKRELIVRRLLAVYR